MRFGSIKNHLKTQQLPKSLYHQGGSGDERLEFCRDCLRFVPLMQSARSEPKGEQRQYCKECLKERDRRIEAHRKRVEREIPQCEIWPYGQSR